MNENDKNKSPFHFYEYILYGIATIAVFLLAIPLFILKFLSFLGDSASAPLKSAKNIVGVIILLIILVALYSFYVMFMPIDLGTETKSIMVDQADQFRMVSSKLGKAGLIGNEYIFRAIAVVKGIDKNILPGRYDFKGKISAYDILIKLKMHDIATALLTIPEGATIYKIASILSKYLGIDSSEFIARSLDTQFTLGSYNLQGLEGYLFPETYLFWIGIKTDGIINMMIEEFRRKTVGTLDSCPINNLKAKEVLVLASIIEAEALFEDEMPLISSVYHNRLRIGMILQADPTINYALGGIFRPLKYSDLKINSPYNTYLIKGLPPGPINSPGIEAIKAAQYPAKTDFLYFVADGMGRHKFSKTLEEHNRAKRLVKSTRKISAKNQGI
jgi:UPF0755 protein